MKTTQHSMLRNILGIRLKHKRSIQDIKNTTKIKNIGEKIKKLKFSYAGHLARASNFKWNKIATSWTPKERKRRRGRPQIRWVDEVDKVTGFCWSKIAQDRKKWADLAEAYAQSWAASVGQK